MTTSQSTLIGCESQLARVDIDGRQVERDVRSCALRCQPAVPPEVKAAD
jgi:hypothetical protein